MRERVVEPFFCLRKRHMSAKLVDKRKQIAAQAGPIVEAIKLDRLHASIKPLPP